MFQVYHARNIRENTKPHLSRINYLTIHPQKQKKFRRLKIHAIFRIWSIQGFNFCSECPRFQFSLRTSSETAVRFAVLAFAASASSVIGREKRLTRSRQTCLVSFLLAILGSWSVSTAPYKVDTDQLSVRRRNKKARRKGEEQSEPLNPGRISLPEHRRGTARAEAKLRLWSSERTTPTRDVLRAHNAQFTFIEFVWCVQPTQALLVSQGNNTHFLLLLSV